MWWFFAINSIDQMSPFEALNRYPPAMIGEFNIATVQCPAATTMLAERDTIMLQQLKANLLKTQNEMKLYADKNPE
jgi:hypothetical protein